MELTQTPSQRDEWVIKNEPAKKSQLKNQHKKRNGRISAGGGNCHGAPVFCCCAHYCMLPVNGRDFLHTPGQRDEWVIINEPAKKPQIKKPAQEEKWEDACWGWKLPWCTSFLLFCMLLHAPSEWERFFIRGSLQNPRGIVPSSTPYVPKMSTHIKISTTSTWF